jgi:hypothetical protein
VETGKHYRSVTRRLAIAGVMAISMLSPHNTHELMEAGSGESRDRQTQVLRH